MVLTLLLLAVPASLFLAYVIHAPPLWTFAAAIVGIVPLAEWIRRATEQLGRLAGPAVGGLLNVTFGNVTELVLALFVLAEGQTEVVKGQITGSIIGNGLLGLGVAILVGTWGREKLAFPRERAGLQSSLLVLSVVALLVPALFDYTERTVYSQQEPGDLDERLSLGVSVILILVYAAALVYTLVTHRAIFEMERDAEPAAWGVWTSLGILAGATAAIAVEADLVAGALEATVEALGATPFFLGVLVLAIIGNAAEYVSAVYFARQDRLGLTMSLTVGSTVQVALMVAPLLVIVSYLIRTPMNLVFGNPLELIAVAAVAFVVKAISDDGEATWFEGLLLVSVYVILAMAFFFVTP